MRLHLASGSLSRLWYPEGSGVAEGRASSVEFGYDAFVSYSARDKTRVRPVAEALRSAGLRVWFDEWSIGYGTEILLEVERGLTQARTLVQFLSVEALKSDWVTLERNSVMFRDPNNEARRFVPVVLDDCELPDMLRRFRFVDGRVGVEELEPSAVRAECRAAFRFTNSLLATQSGYTRTVLAPLLLRPISGPWCGVVTR